MCLREDFSFIPEAVVDVDVDTKLGALADFLAFGKATDLIFNAGEHICLYQTHYKNVLSSLLFHNQVVLILLRINTYNKLLI